MIEPMIREYVVGAWPLRAGGDPAAHDAAMRVLENLVRIRRGHLEVGHLRRLVTDLEAGHAGTSAPARVERLVQALTAVVHALEARGGVQYFRVEPGTMARAA